MTNRNYKRGRGLEYEVRTIFREHGFETIRGAGSKGNVALPDGVMKVDLIATKQSPTQTKEVWVVLMQMKSKKRRSK